MEHEYRTDGGIWLFCDCHNPFDSHTIISFGFVPTNKKRHWAFVKDGVSY